jgi:plasmid stability protein
MPVTFTIKQVPDRVAEALRERAARNRRSLQRELLVMLEHAASEWTIPSEGREPEGHHRRRDVRGKNVRPESRKPPAAGRLTLAELWQRARDLGGPSASESVDIIRRDRDARSGR